MVPQECGAKEEVRWAKITDRKGRGMLFEMDKENGPMMFSALPYTPHEMENAMHPYELPQIHYTVGLNVIVLVLSIGLVCWLRGYYIDSIRLLFPQLETGTLWAAISMGILLFIVVSVINILAVKRKVLSIWMHKS